MAFLTALFNFGFLALQLLQLSKYPDYPSRFKVLQIVHSIASVGFMVIGILELKGYRTQLLQPALAFHIVRNSIKLFDFEEMMLAGFEEKNFSMYIAYNVLNSAICSCLYSYSFPYSRVATVVHVLLNALIIYSC